MVTLIKLKPAIISFTFFFLLESFLFSQSSIDTIELAGLDRTKQSYILNELTIHEGMPLDSSIIRKDIQHLENLQLFSMVKYEVVKEGEKHVIKFYFEEKFTIFPIVNFGGIKENFWFELGATDFNWMGRRYTLGGIYRYFERHSFIIFAKMPYFKQSKFGLDFDLSKLSRTDPAYFDEETVHYDTDFYKASGHLMYSFRFNHFIFFGGGVVHENYRKTFPGQESPGPESFEIAKVQLQTGHYIENIDYSYNLLQGYSNRITFEKVISIGKDLPFHKILNEFRYFQEIGKNGNLAFRNVTGFSTHSSSPFAVFVLDNYLNIRGVGDRVARGTAQWIINAEYRHNLLTFKNSRFQALLFSDNGALRSPGGKLHELITAKNIHSYYGIGLRYYNHRIYNLTLRLDLGMNVNDFHQNGFVLGVNQYF